MAQYSMIDLFDALEEAEAARDAANVAGEAAMRLSREEASIGHDTHAALAAVEAFVAATAVASYDALIAVLNREIAEVEREYAAQDGDLPPFGWDDVDWDDLPLD